MPGDLSRRRVYLVSAFVLSFYFVILGVSGAYQIFYNEKYKKIIYENIIRKIIKNEFRGFIFDRNRFVLAGSGRIESVFADPVQIDDIEEFAHKVSKLINVPEDKIIEKIEPRKKRRFVMLKEGLTGDEILKVKKNIGKIKGLHFLYPRLIKRFYPFKTLAGQLLGYINEKAGVKEGIEAVFDKDLSGKIKEYTLISNRKSRKKMLETNDFLKLKNSIHHVILTIDKNIQKKCEEVIANTVNLYNGDSGVVIVTDVPSGKVLAMANYPFFNPNSYNIYPLSYRKNKAIVDCLEPGSTMKPISLSIALQEGVTKPDEVFHIKSRTIYVDGEKIHDLIYREYVPLIDSLKISSNITVHEYIKRLDSKVFYDYLKKFGFGKKTGIGLPGETPGILRPYYEWASEFDKSSIGYGQGICVSPIQLITALNVIPRGGIYKKPSVVEAVVDSEGKVVRSFPEDKGVRIIKKDVTEFVVEAMRKVLEKGGTGIHAYIPFYDIAGKTGTGQVPYVKKRGYYKDRWNALFYGFFPAKDPKFSILVIVYNPKIESHGGRVAAPAFKKITKFLVSYTNMIPEVVKKGDQSFPKIEAKNDSTVDFSKNNDIKIEDYEAVVPDFRGLRLKECLLLAEKFHVNIRPSGTGRVVYQSIEPFTEVAPWTEVKLIFMR